MKRYSELTHPRVHEKGHRHCSEFDPLFIGHLLHIVLAAAWRLIAKVHAKGSKNPVIIRLPRGYFVEA
jgi:hypothetical protein